LLLRTPERRAAGTQYRRFSETVSRLLKKSAERALVFAFAA
jgi:hypothetical protein